MRDAGLLLFTQTSVWCSAFCGHAACWRWAARSRPLRSWLEGALGTRGASWKQRASRLGRGRTVTRWLSALGGQCPSFPEWKLGQAKGRSSLLPPFHGPLACRVGNGQNGTHVTKPRQARSFPNTASSAPATAPRLRALAGATGHVGRRKRRTVRLALIHSGSVSF